jgi:hypothetical protein
VKLMRSMEEKWLKMFHKKKRSFWWNRKIL